MMSSGGEIDSILQQSSSPMVFYWAYFYRSAGQLRKDGQELGCPRQDLDDGEGRALADTVEHFARDNEDWIQSFTAVFSRMQANGYTGDQLNTQDLQGFFKHME